MTTACWEEVMWLQFLDRETDDKLTKEMEEHLQICVACKETVREVGELVGMTAGLLASSHEMDSQVAGRGAWRQTGSFRSNRSWLYAVAGLAVLALLVTVQPLRSAFASFFQVFEANDIKTVTLTTADLDQMANALSQNGKVKLAGYGAVETLQPIQWLQGSYERMLTQSGLPNEWPKSLANSTTMQANLSTEGHFELKFNVAAINQLIQQEGGTQLFPTSAGTLPIDFTLPAVLDVNNFTTSPQGQGTVGYELIETHSPVVEVPQQIDLAQVKDAAAALPFLPPQLSSAITQDGDWMHTIILPVTGPARHVTFLGHKAVVYAGADGHSFAVVWIDNGVISAFRQMYAGQMDEQQFLQNASGLLS